MLSAECGNTFEFSALKLLQACEAINLIQNLFLSELKITDVIYSPLMNSSNRQVKETHASDTASYQCINEPNCLRIFLKHQAACNPRITGLLQISLSNVHIVNGKKLRVLYVTICTLCEPVYAFSRNGQIQAKVCHDFYKMLRSLTGFFRGSLK